MVNSVEKRCSCGNVIKLDKKIAKYNQYGYWQNCVNCDSTVIFRTNITGRYVKVMNKSKTSEKIEKISDDELRDIFRILEEAYAAAGKNIQTGVVYTDGKEEIIIDNREDEDIN